jgi:glycosyltransferase involved in cell wall biosynthesis
LNGSNDLVNIAILAAGAGDMICGSCLRDNAMASALTRLGHRVSLVPLYTPLRTDTQDISQSEVFYGGINVYLQHVAGLFRHTPRAMDWIFDRHWLLSMAGNMGAQTPPDKVAGLTAGIIEGIDGPERKELDRLIGFLKDLKPQVVSLPNLMFIGAAEPIRRHLNVPVVCELTGEDIFLDAMAEPNRVRLRELIRRRAADVTRFVSATEYYAKRMSQYLGVAPDRIDVVPTGVAEDLLRPLKARADSAAHPKVVGYLARICPEKGLDRLVEALLLLRQKSGFEKVRLLAAGYLGARDQKWFDQLKQRIDDTGLRDGFTYLGEVERAEKIEMLDSIDVLSVPTAYPEAKGIYVLEGLARGVPVVQPAHGSFPELMAQTGGGVLVPPGDAGALALAIADLLNDPARHRQLSQAGRAAVESRMTEQQMATRMLEVYQKLI